MELNFAKILSAVVVVLTILLFVTYRQNRMFHAQNTTLILINDSVMSANIELTKQISRKDSVRKRFIKPQK
jgi:hypothetical protein